MAATELGRQKRETQGEGVRETDHSAFSDEPDACCYADHREGNGKRRESERGRGSVEHRDEGEAKYGRQLELNPPLSGQGDRQANGRCERSRMPWNASRRIGEEENLILREKDWYSPS